MSVSREQIESYEESGFLLLPNYFSQAEVETLRAELPRVLGLSSPEKVVEKEGTTVRSVYGSHKANEIFGRLSRHPRLVGPARALLGGDVYVYQFKINVKAAFGGDVWQWHQDYIYWLKEDGMPSARVVNFIVYLDEMSEFNGPLFLLPGSHREGVIDSPAVLPALRGSDPYSDGPTWIHNLTANLKYTVPHDKVRGMAERSGIVSPKGPRGTVLLTNPNLVHASPHNISPFDRAVVIITYNSVENVPPPSTNPRPDFLVSRDCAPLVPLDDDALLT
ncbi:MAG TPA: phytanoyl-CoA dioxygenase family protein [Pyrinomonadaceae bacterium]